MKLMPGSAAGCCAPAIYREAIVSLSRKSFLAEMLGVQRTSVTTVARTLQEAGMVRYTRGKIEILDVDGLREGASECYEMVREQYEQLLGAPPSEQ
jgi:Mn-dependent DtxR family transcriptional regulator